MSRSYMELSQRGVLRLQLLAVLILAGPILLRARGAEQAPKSAAPAQAKQTYTVWKSQTTNNEYRVRVTGQTLVADWINIPARLANHGAYIHTECHRVGNRWLGTSSSFLPCVAGDSKEANWCRLVTRTELDSLTVDRITGRGQGLKRFDCHSCRILEADWKAFVWVPAKQR